MQYSRYTKLSFVISFRPQKKAKLIIITILKYPEPPIVVEQFWIVLNKQNDIFEFRIFLHPLFSQPLNGISCPKNNLHPGILANLKRPLKNVTVSLFSRFCGTLFCSLCGSNQSLAFWNLSFAIRCRYAPGYFPNIFRTTFYQTTVDGRPHI